MKKETKQFTSLLILIIFISFLENFFSFQGLLDFAQKSIATLSGHIATIIVFFIAALVAQHLLHRYAKDRENRERRLKSIEQILDSMIAIESEIQMWRIKPDIEASSVLNKLIAKLAHIESIQELYFESLGVHIKDIKQQLLAINKKLMSELYFDISRVIDGYDQLPDELRERTTYEEYKTKNINPPEMLLNEEVNEVLNAFKSMKSATRETHKIIESSDS